MKRAAVSLAFKWGSRIVVRFVVLLQPGMVWSAICMAPTGEAIRTRTEIPKVQNWTFSYIGKKTNLPEAENS